MLETQHEMPHRLVIALATLLAFTVNLTTRDASPLSLYVNTFTAAQGDLFIATMSAAATAAVIPVLVAGWVAQRQRVIGLTMGAVK